MTTEFQFDQSTIAERYDDGRRSAAATSAVLTDLLRSHRPERLRWVVDLGCGTGRFSALLATAFEVPVIGIELSSKMLAVAAAKALGPSVRFVRGSISAIPIDAGAVDVAFISQVLHHVDLPKAMMEISRVLAPGGRLFVRQTTRENLDSYLYQRFFPETRSIDERRLPLRGEVVAAARGARLTPYASLRTICTEVASSSREYLEKVATRTYSDLAMISDESFSLGLADFTRYAEANPDQAWFEDVDYLVLEAGS